MSDTPDTRLCALVSFIGSENWYRHALVPTITYTDGAKYVADQVGAYWLLDEIALGQRFQPTVQREPFQLWRLIVQPGHRATLICEDGDGIELYRRQIHYTDFPVPGIQLYFCDGVIMLPGEY